MIVNPLELTGLKQAGYILNCLVSGQSKKQMVDMFGGDEQLVVMWTLFLKHNQWMEEGPNGWSITNKGKKWSHNMASDDKLQAFLTTTLNTTKDRSLALN